MKTYALRTEDPQNVLRSLLVSDISINAIQKAYDNFVDLLCASLKNNSAEPVLIEIHSFEDLEESKKKLLDPNKKYLNFDSQSSLGGVQVGVSRKFSYKPGEQLGITSRPGYDELNDQLSNILAQHGTKFGIIEDDIFTGGTLKVMIEAIQNLGAEVDSVISGISSTRKVDDVPVKAAVYYNPDTLLELTDPRDYIFGASDGGLVVSRFGRKFRVPYCSPLVDVAKRSSIDPAKVKVFSSDILDANIKLHDCLKTSNLPARLYYPKVLFDDLSLDADITVVEMLVKLEHHL